MSWDLFIQDLPVEARSVAEIPDDFKPRPIGSRAEVLAKIRTVCPDADFDDPTWGVIETPEGSVEINIGEADPVMGFALHVRGGAGVIGLIVELLDTLGLRAIDPGSDTGFFDSGGAAESLARWRAYRETVRRQPAPTR